MWYIFFGSAFGVQSASSSCIICESLSHLAVGYAKYERKYSLVKKKWGEYKQVLITYTEVQQFSNFPAPRLQLSLSLTPLLSSMSSCKLLRTLLADPVSSPQIFQTLCIQAVKSNQRSCCMLPPAKTATKQGDWTESQKKFPNYET